MLNNLLDGWFKFPLGEGAFYAVFGFVFVFVGIIALIIIITIIGKILGVKSGSVAKKEKAPQKAEVAPVQAVAPVVEENVSPEVVAVITAALMAYYGAPERAKGDFIVKRIRKI